MIWNGTEVVRVDGVEAAWVDGMEVAWADGVEEDGIEEAGERALNYHHRIHCIMSHVCYQKKASKPTTLKKAIFLMKLTQVRVLQLAKMNFGVYAIAHAAHFSV